MVAAQCFNTSVISCLGLFGKEAPWNSLIMIAVMCHTFTTFSMPWTVICTGTRSLIFTWIHNICASFHFVFFMIIAISFLEFSILGYLILI